MNTYPEKDCKFWDGKKVWALIDDMWRQATVIACSPNPLPSKSWTFILQCKHDSYRHVLNLNPIENGNEFENIEAAEYIDMSMLCNIADLNFDTLPNDSPTIELGQDKCPIHPFVAEYIKRLLYQLEVQSEESITKRLVAAESELSRLRMERQACSAPQAKQLHEAQLHVQHLESENKALNLKMDSLTLQLQSLRATCEGSSGAIHLQESNEIRALGHRIQSLATRFTKFDEFLTLNGLSTSRFKSIESEDVPSMIAALWTGVDALNTTMTALESARGTDPITLKPPHSAGSIAEQIDALRSLLSAIKTRVDCLTDSSSPSSAHDAAQRLLDLEYESQEMYRLLQTASEEREATTRYIDSAMNENASLRHQLVEAQTRILTLEAAVSKKPTSSGLFW